MRAGWFNTPCHDYWQTHGGPGFGHCNKQDSGGDIDPDGTSGNNSNGDIRDPAPIPVPGIKQVVPPSGGVTGNPAPPGVDPAKNPAPPSGAGSSGFNSVPNGYAEDWHTIRFSNTTQEPLTVAVTVASGQPLPKGVKPDGTVEIPPGQYVDVTFAPGSSANFKSTKGDGSVWNQGEVFFDESNKVIWGNMSYIYGANSNMRMFSEDGQHAGYRGDILANAPDAAKVGDWGIMAPYDRFHHSDDPNNPGSATGGPDGAKNAGSAYLYSVLEKGEGYVGRGRPAEVTDYDDASSLRFTGKLAVVF